MPLNMAPVLASAFTHGGDREYARDDGTSTWEALEEVIGGLEEAHAVSFASGMAAIAAVFDQVPTGSTIVLPDDCYQGVVGLAMAGQESGRWMVERLAVHDTPAWIAASGRADLIWLESVSNPLLVVADIQAIAAAPRKAGAILAVDNTFPTALNLRPLELGADACVQSATKLIGGHSDLLAGVVTTKNEKLAALLTRRRELAGATPGAFEAFLATRR
jgi:cystathionine gamma-synthase